MALTNAQVREILSTAGVDGEHMAAAEEKIITGHKASIDALREERDKYKTDAEKLPNIQKELDELKEATKNGEKSPYKAKYEAVVEEKEALQKEFDQYKSDLEAKETRKAKEDAYRDILKDAGIPEKHFVKILKYSDIDGVELDKDGKIKTAQDVLKAVKEEWSDHIESTGEQGAKTETPPANTGGKENQPSRAAQIARQYHENLYGKEEK